MKSESPAQRLPLQDKSAFQYKTPRLPISGGGTMKYPREAILGALLMIAAFAMGMLWSSSAAPPAQEFIHRLAEILTAVSSVALVAVTFLLFKATNDLARATDALVETAQGDSRNRKIRQTNSDWTKLMNKIGELPDLTKGEFSDAAIAAGGKKIRLELRELERGCKLFYSGVHDLKTVNKISGSWFLQQVRRAEPYICQRQERKPAAYKVIVNLKKEIERFRSDTKGRRAADGFMHDPSSAGTACLTGSEA